MLNIPIVIAAYNRKAPLERLLNSLNKAVYSTEVMLIISIDGGIGNSEIIDLANQFEWHYGEKQVIASEHNMGLRNHILKCGQLAKKYDGIILLEDDLYVSPYFYTYVMQAQNIYRHDEKITGVALYSHQYNETACLPFKPIDDGCDVFFMQVACSWGQSWLTHQWQAFEEWYELNHDLDLSCDNDMPPEVRLWPKTSWKKYYLKYIIVTQKYFVYPRVSLVTNFADPGVHHSGSNIFQAPLLYNDMVYVLPELSQSIARYDAYCEIVPDTLSEFMNALVDYDFAVDLYGMKNKHEIKSKYVITTQHLTNAVMSFGRKLKPHELNVCENLPGDEIRFGLKSDMLDYGLFLEHRNNLNQDYLNTHAYFYSITIEHYKPTVQQMQVALYKRIYKKIRRILKSLLR